MSAFGPPSTVAHLLVPPLAQTSWYRDGFQPSARSMRLFMEPPPTSSHKLDTRGAHHGSPAICGKRHDFVRRLPAAGLPGRYLVLPALGPVWMVPRSATWDGFWGGWRVYYHETLADSPALLTAPARANPKAPRRCIADVGGTPFTYTQGRPRRHLQRPTNARRSASLAGRPS